MHRKAPSGFLGRASGAGRAQRTPKSRSPLLWALPCPRIPHGPRLSPSAWLQEVPSSPEHLPAGVAGFKRQNVFVSIETCDTALAVRLP